MLFTAGLCDNQYLWALDRVVGGSSNCTVGLTIKRVLFTAGLCDNQYLWALDRVVGGLSS